MAGNKRGPDVRTFIAYTVTVAWAVTTGVDLFVQRYDPPPGVQAVMMLVAGAFFYDKVRKPNGGGDTPGPEEADT